MMPLVNNAGVYQRMKLCSALSVALSISLLSFATPLVAAPVNTLGTPWSSGFSPWSMGTNPWSSGLSPWSMGTNPWSSGFSPWRSMGGNSPWSSGFNPWGGNAWNSSVWPWANGSGWGNSWGSNSWMPWSSGSNFFGRRNNDDWVRSMFLMNSLNNQQPWAMGAMPGYNYQAPAWQQNIPMPMQSAPNMMAYPQPALPLQTPQIPSPSLEPSTQPPVVESNNFPATSSSFSPFLDSPAPANDPLPSAKPALPEPSLPSSKPTDKVLVFPDGSRF